MKLVLTPLLFVTLLSSCGNIGTSKFSGLPSEGDTVIADLNERFARAQVIDRPNLLELILEKNYACEMHDARSFTEPDAGSNDLAYQARFFRSEAQGIHVRYDWRTSRGPASSIADAGFDQFGFGIPGVTGGSCAGTRIVNMVRRDYMNRLLIEAVWLEPCPATGNPSRLRPVSRPGFSVLSYSICSANGPN